MLAASNQRTQLHKRAQDGLKQKRNIVAFGNESDDEATEQINGGVNGITSHRKAPQSRQTLLAERKRLPIWSGRKALVKSVQENDTLIVLGETGSGKTTRESNPHRELHASLLIPPT